MKTQEFTHLDADESIFFTRQLEHVKAKTYDIKFTELKVRMLIPTSFEAGPGAETIRYEQFDMVGMAKVVADYARDFPRADVKAKEFISPIKSLGASYGYSVQEIRAAAHAGKPLQQRKADAARRAISQQENRIALVGDADFNLPGWLTNVNIPDVALPADGAGALTTFASKVTTPDLIVRDLNSIANAVVNQSNGVEKPNTMLMPIAQKTLLGSTPRSINSDTTILKYFLQNNAAGVVDCDWLAELAAAQGFVGADTCIAYDRNPNAFTLEIPQDFEQFRPQEKGLEFEVPVHQRIGGVLLYYPLSQAKSNDV
jgi:hypothetical protein